VVDKLAVGSSVRAQVGVSVLAGSLHPTSPHAHLVFASLPGKFRQRPLRFRRGSNNDAGRTTTGEDRSVTGLTVASTERLD